MTTGFDEADDEVERSKTRHIDGPLGEALRLERDGRGLTRARLAEMLDVSDSTLQKYEEGRVRISASRLWQICNLLDVDVGRFFENLPHHVERRSDVGLAENGRTFVRDDGRGRKAAAVARAAAKLSDDRLEIAAVLIQAQKRMGGPR